MFLLRNEGGISVGANLHPPLPPPPSPPKQLSIDTIDLSKYNCGNGLRTRKGNVE